MKCHTELRRERRIIKTKQWKSRRHRRCIEQRSLLANSISNLYTKRLPQNSYQEFVRYNSVALLCRRHLRDIVFSSVPSVTPCALYVRVLVYHSIFRKDLFYYSVLLYSKDNSNIENRKGVNYLSINALLACKRCPLSPLITPFWSPIKHLFFIVFVTI